MKLLICIAMCLPRIASACLWLSGTTLDGNHTNLEIRNSAHLLERSLKGTPEEKIRNLVIHNASAKSRNFVNVEILAFEALAKADYESAIKTLKQAAKNSPNNYSIAANLGTAYELNGNLNEALLWIKESIRINPDSHYGTEWLHIAILEEKIRIQDSETTKRTKDFLTIPKKFDDSAIFSIAGKSYTVDQISKALLYQLNERMVFVKPEDPIVADLLFDYALVLANTATLETAIRVLNLADQYGYQDRTNLNQTKADYKKIILKRKAKPYAWGILTLTGIITLLVYAYHKKLFFLSSVDYQKYKKAQEKHPEN